MHATHMHRKEKKKRLGYRPNSGDFWSKSPKQTKKILHNKDAFLVFIGRWETMGFSLGALQFQNKGFCCFSHPMKQQFFVQKHVSQGFGEVCDTIWQTQMSGKKCEKSHDQRMGADFLEFKFLSKKATQLKKHCKKRAILDFIPSKKSWLLSHHVWQFPFKQINNKHSKKDLHPRITPPSVPFIIKGHGGGWVL